MQLAGPFQTAKFLFEVCNPSFQNVIARREDEYYGSNRAPSLAAVSAAHGNKVCESWLSIQLQDLAEYAGAKDKMRDLQCENAASIISSQFYFLTIAEMLIFFVHFKAGKYGRFYGAVDPLVITQALQEFVKERAVKIEKKERERRNAEHEASAQSEGITYEQYLELKRRAANGDSDAINQLKRQ